MSTTTWYGGRSGLGLAGVAALVSVAGFASAVRADDDDAKALSRKQPVIAKGFRQLPDPWKLASQSGPIANQGDEEFVSKNIILKAWLPLNEFGGFPTSGDINGADCWGYTSASGREYALMGLSWGNGIVEVTDPANPVIIATIPGGVQSLWRDITVIGSYAYAVSDSVGVGIQVLDLSQVDSGVVTLIRNFAQGGHTTTHTLINNPDSGFMYACGGNAAGGRAIPVATTPDPTFPTFTGVQSPTNYVHEAMAVNYTTGPYAGKEIVFLFTGSAGMEIVDYTDKNNPVTLSQGSYPGERYGHQGWLSIDRKYLYLNDELDSPTSGNVPRFLTRVFNVENLSMPRLVSTITNGLPSVDHNEYTVGRYLYQSNYTSGLRVWDLANPLKPVEVAHIDTRPEDDGTGYNGAWGNYPYFNSGTILISDIERGLFIVKLSVLQLALPGSAPATLTPSQATPVSVQVTEFNAATESVALMVSVNGGTYQPYPMTAQGAGLFAGTIPPQTCNDRISYYFVAETDDATPRTFTWPVGAEAGDTLKASVQASQTTLFSDNFQTSLGWTIQNDASLTAGGWARATPLANGGTGAVIGDGDGSGMCYVTGNTLNADVDGGPTRLVSPVLDLSAAPEARISYWRWLLSIVSVNDALVTEISADNGANWTQVHSVVPVTGGWEQVTFRVADYITPTSQVLVRFSVGDAANNSTTEAGIDGFVVVSPSCTACYANCDGSSLAPILNVNDFICFQNLYAAGNPAANCDGSSAAPILNVNDFICFQNQFAAGCP